MREEMMPKPNEQQVVEIPAMQLEVVVYQLHQLECEHCGTKTRAKLPAGVSERGDGKRLAAMATPAAGIAQPQPQPSTSPQILIAA